jgi:hypothetical protein
VRGLGLGLGSGCGVWTLWLLGFSERQVCCSLVVTLIAVLCFPFDQWFLYLLQFFSARLSREVPWYCILWDSDLK